ncbi:cation:dicarboxylate symporter family transporter, partial [Staphylococcus chromogenes]
VARGAGVEGDWQCVRGLVVVVVLSSLGVAGVGGGVTFASILVLSALNWPVGLAGVLISVEPLIDMGRTALNVNDSILAGTGTAKLTKQLDENQFKSNHYDELASEH